MLCCESNYLDLFFLAPSLHYPYDAGVMGHIVLLYYSHNIKHVHMSKKCFLDICTCTIKQYCFIYASIRGVKISNLNRINGQTVQDIVVYIFPGQILV